MSEELKKYNENDELISEGGSKDNLKEGIWKKYFSGKLTSEITYEKDVNVSEIHIIQMAK